MTDREKLIELIDEALESGCRHNSCSNCSYLEEEHCSMAVIADHLIANGVTVQKWIPVTEWLPENRGDVLVCAFWHEKWQTRIGWFAKDMDGWHVKASNVYHIDIPVTHWMPLPEQPKGD